MRPHPLARRSRLPLALLAGLTLAAGGCVGDAAGADERAASTVADAANAAADSSPPAPTSVGGVASLEEALAEFRVGLPVVTALESAAPSRDALVARFARAVARADTNDLRAMVVSRAEFAHLYYPTSAYTRRPTRQGAPLVWFLHTQESQKGVSRLLDRFGGQPLRLADYSCHAEPVVEEDNRLWTGCRLRLVLAEGDTADYRYFGPILERDGRFKIYSYKNDF